MTPITTIFFSIGMNARKYVEGGKESRQCHYENGSLIPIFKLNLVVLIECIMNLDW